MALLRFRDVGNFSFGSQGFSCPTSVTVTLGSDVLRGRCGAAISERYQGLTNLNAEISVELPNPFLNIHPGDSGSVSVRVPGALFGIGIPGTGITISMTGICTQHSGRIEKDSLASGTYVFRGLSANGTTPPISISTGAAISDDDDAGGTPATFIRDIANFAFAATGGGISDEDFCPRAFEFSENTEIIEDWCQGELWPTYVGITGLNLTASVTGRNIKEAFDKGGVGGKALGSKGTITFGVLTGSDIDCAGLEVGGAMVMSNMNINEISFSASHGEMSEVTISFTGHGSVGELDDSDLRAIAVFS